ncbi:sigma-70 family RNA polymerase sigma factor [uncultured Sphingomonas sp.]|uniref:sigma-70 family RNA polymerase sigma factor n=1 Tax=uncultured Sphingomonas sp. TaxID=158754 RepID=UPI0025DB66C5|nr:sigma-70 family RNA polymerase sigma factor [uncultured Sphingomonas sp.]
MRRQIATAARFVRIDDPHAAPMMNRPGRILALFAAQRRRLIAEAVRLTGDTASAEDIVQEAWIRLSKGAAGTCIDAPVGYVSRVVRNLALDEYRQRQRREQVTLPAPEGDPDMPDGEAVSVERALMAREELALVTAELARMPARMRRAVELHRVSGAPLREIATELGVSVTTAHGLVTQGVERCRKCLERTWR